MSRAFRAQSSGHRQSPGYRARIWLIQQVVFEVYAAASGNMGPQIQAESTATSRLKAYIESNLAFMRNYRKHIIALHEIWSNRRSNVSASSLIMTKHESGLCDLERLLVNGQDAGEFRDFNPRTLAMIRFFARLTVWFTGGTVLLDCIRASWMFLLSSPAPWGTDWWQGGVSFIGHGKIGINAEFLDQTGPNLIQDAVVEGFETGIQAQWI